MLAELSVEEQFLVKVRRFFGAATADEVKLAIQNAQSPVDSDEKRIGIMNAVLAEQSRRRAMAARSLIIEPITSNPLPKIVSEDEGTLVPKQ